MAIMDIITDEMVERAVNSIPTKNFNTLHFIEKLIELEFEAVDEVKNWSSRNWRGLIGKALKRYSVETNKIDQISPSDESPARWRKR
ncbi:hypothetical protein MASR1M107_22580 [Ignavibacteriales bacterium]